MASFEEIEEARKLLKLFESASILELEKKFKERLFEWHPDKNLDNQQEATEMTEKIIRAHEIIMEYFKNYKIPFSKEAVTKYCSIDEWWFNRFGSDPLWGNKK